NLFDIYSVVMKEEADIKAAKDRGESTALMEPLLIGETSRHRGALTGGFSPEPAGAPSDIVGRSRAGDELLLQQPDRRAPDTSCRYRARPEKRLQQGCPQARPAARSESAYHRPEMD